MKKVWVKACGISEESAPNEYVEEWVTDEEYEDYIDYISDHCQICGKRIGEYDEFVCDDCRRDHVNLQNAIWYQKKTLKDNMDSVEIPALWVKLLGETTITAVLQREFESAVELYKAYLPDTLDKTVKDFCLEDELDYWDKIAERLKEEAK